MKNESILETLGLQRVTIPLPFRLDHVHCFLAKGEKDYTIIDSGLHHKDSITTWREQLKGKDVGRIILTHLHPDHTGYAGKLQEETNAEVYMTKIDAEAMRTIWQEEAIPSLEKDYAKFSVPTEIRDEVVRLTRGTLPAVTPLPTVQDYLRDGEQIEIGPFIYDIIATPGHSEGLITLYQKETKALLSTDHILPEITPNIAYWFYGEKNPLKSYEQSLEKIKMLDIAVAIPSHGGIFTNVHERIEEIWSHHEERLQFTYEAMKDGITVFDMCHLLFPYELTNYDYQFAIGETVAHMEYIRHEGRCERMLENGEFIYRSM